MITRAHTVTFEGIDPRLVEVECVVSPGLPSFSIVGLPDKAVSEARERIRAAFSTMAIALPSKKITINLTPADLPKEGSHFDLAIALSLLGALEVIPKDYLDEAISIGELSLDGRINPVNGALPAALSAAEFGKSLFCPETCGAEAAWVDGTKVIGAKNLRVLIQHLNGMRPIEPALPGQISPLNSHLDMRDVKGQERAKRAIEIAAAGRHHLLMVGPSGSGKSMLAARLPSILPQLSPAEALETSMVHSLAGLIESGGINRNRPFREPHHTASTAAIIGGGRTAKPGEISLAHNGVLFMDELPEFQRSLLETLRQPIETGEVMIARANAHIKYPCKFLLVAAANPCKCGYLTDPAQACGRAPLCGQDYLGRISGPLMDRFDLRLEVPPVSFQDLDLPASGDSSSQITARVQAARCIQEDRYASTPHIRTNADATGEELNKAAMMSPCAKDMLTTVSERFKFSARGYHRVMRVARTIADLDASGPISRSHLAEAVSFRLLSAPET
jgi:magnesium chelatase family protein